MITVNKMNSNDFNTILDFAKNFYSSNAVNHSVPEQTLAASVTEAIGDNPNFVGYTFKDGEKTVGFSYISTYFESEIGGICVLIEDIYIVEKHRGQGICSRYFDFIFNEYSFAKRFRIELTPENNDARRLYERIGFKTLSYDQMIIDQ